MVESRTAEKRKPNTNIKISTARGIVMVLAVMVLIGVVMGKNEQITKLRNQSSEGNQEMAQGYFRLGVATGDTVNLTHKIKGEPEVSGEQLYRECVQHDIDMSNGTTLLKLP